MARAVKIAILGDSSSLARALRSSESRMERINKTASKMGKALGIGFGVAAAAAVGFAASTVKSASDAQQSIGATETVFGKHAKSVIALSNKAAKTVGLSANQYRENANIIGSLFANKGLKGNELAKQTDLVIKKGADLSATFGGTATEAVEALSSAFKGEFDPLERYGISLKQSTVNTEAETLAKKKYGKALKNLSTEQQNAIQRQATQNLINQQSAKSQGAFSRETNTLAHQQQVLAAKFENIKAKVGSFLLPVLTKLGSWFNDTAIPAAEKYAPIIADKLAPAFDAVKSAVEKVQPILAAIGRFMKDNPAVIRNVAITIGILAGAIGVWSAAMAIANAVMALSPLTWILVGIVALVAGITLLVTHWDDVTRVMKKAWGKVKEFGSFLKDGFLKLIGKVGDFGKDMGKKVWSGITNIGSKLKTIGTWIWSNVYPGPLLRLGDKVLGAAKSIGGKVWTGIKHVGGDLKTIGSWAWGKFEGGLDKLKTKFTNKGGELLSGLVHGLENKWDSVKNLTKKPLNLIIDVAINPFLHTINKLPGVNIKDVKRFATGGAVFGAGTSTSDSIPALLSNDEHVLTAREVKGMGGHGVVERLRKWAVSKFAKGGRVWPLAGGTPSTYAGHTGVDLNAPNDYGKPVHAVTGGTAYGQVLTGSYGRNVRLNGGGVQQIYGHLSAFGKLGRVSAGDVIGYVGSTGNSTGPHLHFEVRPGGTYASALAFLNGASQPSGKGGFLSGLLGKFGDIKSFAMDKMNSLLGKVSGGGLLTGSSMTALVKHLLQKVMSTIPGLATGGIVRASSGGTIIRAGEGGLDEAIVPMRRGGYRRAQTIIHNHFTIQASPATDKVALAKELKDIIDTGKAAGVRFA